MTCPTWVWGIHSILFTTISSMTYRLVLLWHLNVLVLFISIFRNVDKELELVWRNAAADNKRMKNTVRQKGAMFDSDSDPNAHLSSEEGEAT